MKAETQHFDSDSDIDPAELQQLYSQLLNKQKNRDIGRSRSPDRKSRSRSRDREGISVIRVKNEEPDTLEDEKFHLHTYKSCAIDLSSIPQKIRVLPVFKKHSEILDTILRNQIVLITGETGCGKSTQIPRILYQYLKASNTEGKILCVQPRRLAAVNLEKILSKQILESGVVSYHIAMDNNIRPSTKILFMTNGIFLQRFIHSVEQLLKEFPFIILDEVHERDIDTDFILLAVKHIVRSNPKLRVVLMSATVDNGLFQYYFSEDHITKFMKDQNIYLKCLQMRDRNDKKKKRDERSDSEDSEQIRIQETIALDFMKSEKPCPSITITEQGAYSKQYFYLEDLDLFFKRPILIQWANTSFNLKFPYLMKEFVNIGASIVHEILTNPIKVEAGTNSSILVFLPGFAQIQLFCSKVEQVVGKQANFDIIQLHSSTLNSETSRLLNESNPPRPRLIVATNIAESSITVMGVKYVIDFCLSKEVKFNHKTRLQNLQMIWTSQASSEQRAGRTGRVCNGVVIRMTEKVFFQTLHKYSTPQIQRCSLDRLILRIKLLHENELMQKGNNRHQIFVDPGQVLGRAIQPPSLKNIDASIKSLMFNGGLQLSNDQFHLTNLGRLYVDLPVDIIYSRMLIMSLIFGTFDDIVILVTLLQQSKTPFKKQGIERKYLDYWQMMVSQSMCDFYGMVQVYKRKYLNKENMPEGIDNYHPSQIRTHRVDIEKRLSKLDIFKNRRACKQDQKLRFKLTIWASFLDNSMKVVLPSHDQKHEKRIRHLKNKQIPLDKTLVINSTVIKKHRVYERTDGFVNDWKSSINSTFRLVNDPVDIVLDFTQSYVVFENEQNLMKIMFSKNMEQNYGGHDNVIKEQELRFDDDPSKQNERHLNFPSCPVKPSSRMNSVLNGLGDIEFLQKGEAMDVQSNRKVNIDNLSVNRIICVHPNMDVQYVVTNSKVDKASGSYCRYTSLLPNQRGLYQLLMMMFYPYLSVKPDQGMNHYQTIKLRKRVKINVGFQLCNQDIKQINEVRSILKRLLNLETNTLQQDVAALWPKLKSMMDVQRIPVMDQRKWQKAFLEQRNYQSKQEQVEDIPEVQLKYMSPITPYNLKNGYFSFQHLSADVYKRHVKEYNEWKAKILGSLQDMKEFISSTQTHICCRECKHKISRIRNVGVIDRNSFMRAFEPLPNSIKQASFDEMENDFCTMMMSTDITDYTVHSCPNGHLLAIRMGNPLQYRITQFSAIQIMFPDESLQNVDFQRLDSRNYIGKTNKAISNKRSINKVLVCKVCQQECRSITEMEKHLKSWMHEEVVKEFKLSTNNSYYL